MNFRQVDLLDGPAQDANSLETLHALTYLQVLGYDGDYAQVANPHTQDSGWVESEALGPSDPPPAWVTAPVPPAQDAVNLPGRVVGGASLDFFPVDDPAAATQDLGHNTAVFITNTVQAPDGSEWYQTDKGGYLPEDKVRLPQPPPRTFSGKWIDADLNQPSMLTAYEGSTPVLATLTITGRAPGTPVGVFSIIRRVADETMDSSTVGIPRNGPGGYFLTHVLYTQYFLPTGESIHYNYWSSDFGYEDSHGCLGLSYDDSFFLWNWAGIGTPVSVHR